MIPQSVDRPSPILLGPEDLAVFDRLRAIALILRAAGAIAPRFNGVRIGLRICLDGSPSPIEALTMTGRALIAQVSGWDDLLDGNGQMNGQVNGQVNGQTIDLRSVNTVHARTSQTEFPLGLSPSLTRFLRHIGTNQPVSASVGTTLQGAGWGIAPTSRHLYPILPDQVSAHEALEALTAAEEDGGLGNGPFAALARAAVRALAEGPRP